jgi:hypothetical protein
LVLFFSAIYYRHTTTLAGMAIKTDLFIAFCFLLFFLSFWSIRFIVKKDHLLFLFDKYRNILPKQINIYNPGLCYWSFIILLWGVMLLSALRKWIIFDDPFVLEYGADKFIQPDKLHSFFPVIIGYVKTIFRSILHVLATILMLLPLINTEKKANKKYLILSFLTILCYTFFVLLDGFRSSLVYVPLLLCICIFFAYIKHMKVSYWAIPLTFMLCLFSFIAIINLGEFRYHTTIAQNMRDKNIGHVIVATFKNSKVNEVFWRNWDRFFKKQTKEQYMREENQLQEIKKTKQNVLLNKPTEKKLQDNNELPNQDKISAGVDISEKEYLQNYRPISFVDIIAWTQAYYGKYTDFLGLFYTIKILPYTFIPRTLVPEQPLKVTRHILLTKMGKKRAGSGAYSGIPFAEGYACYGYLGAFLHSIAKGVFFGLITHISWILLIHFYERIEFLSLSLLFFLMVALFSADTFDFAKTIFPSFLVLIIILLLFRFLYYKTEFIEKEI